MPDQILAHPVQDLDAAAGSLRTKPTVRAQEMKDLTHLTQRLQMLRDDAEGCLLISRLAADPTKRQTFRKLATQLESAELGALIAAKRASGET
jgi:hypothetical protein